MHPKPGHKAECPRVLPLLPALESCLLELDSKVTSDHLKCHWLFLSPLSVFWEGSGEHTRSYISYRAYAWQPNLVRTRSSFFIHPFHLCNLHCKLTLCHLFTSLTDLSLIPGDQSYLLQCAEHLL